MILENNEEDLEQELSKCRPIETTKKYCLEMNEQKFKIMKIERRQGRDVAVECIGGWRILFT